MTSAESTGELQDSFPQSARTDATRILVESQAKLIVDQEKDQEIQNLKHQALNERVAAKVPVCYFIKRLLLFLRVRNHKILFYFYGIKLRLLSRKCFEEKRLKLECSSRDLILFYFYGIKLKIIFKKMF